MVIEVGEGDGMWGELDDFAGWAMDAGLWNGRIVTWEEVWDERDAVRERILEHLGGLEEASIAFQQFAFRLASMGADSEGKELIQREFEELRFQDGALIIDSGLKSSLKKFWKKHKKEIAIGAGIMALVTVVVVIAVCTGGTGASAAAAAGGAALDKLNKKGKEDETPAIDEGQLVASNEPPKPKVKHERLLVAVNGMLNSPEDIERHDKYLRSRIQAVCPSYSDERIEWVHNRSHGALDLLEVPALNLKGISPNTGKELERIFTEFHERNLSDKEAVIQVICHSQGAIHVKNALRNCSEEVRQRVLVGALAPGAIVPRRFCNDSTNVASTWDPVPLAERIFNTIDHAVGSEYELTIDSLRLATEDYKELVRLKPHPDAPALFDHDFESPTFQDFIDSTIINYFSRD